MNENDWLCTQIIDQIIKLRFFQVNFMDERDTYDGANELYSSRMRFVPRVGDVIHIVNQYLLIGDVWATHDDGDTEFAWNATITKVSYSTLDLDEMDCAIKPITEEDQRIQYLARDLIRGKEAVRR